MSPNHFASADGSFAASRVTSNGPRRWRPSTLTAPDGAPAVSGGDPAHTSQGMVGHHESRYSILGAVSSPSASNTSVSPRVIRAADGTGMIHAARSDEPVTDNDITIVSVVPSQAISARSSATEEPGPSGT